VRPDEPEDVLEQCWRGAILGSLEGYRDEEWGIYRPEKPERPTLRTRVRTAIRDALLADPTRSDHKIAARVGCSVGPVRMERTALLTAGVIPERTRGPKKQPRPKREMVGRSTVVLSLY
jgi:hypothetical protein